ncbi:MAG TPA: hypothetical protein VF031_01475, partial [Alphaproteobacteria bacterium]
RPRDPGKRALLRFWMEYADEKLLPAIARAITSEAEGRAQAAAKLRDVLIFVEREGLARCSRGPYWLGQELSILDLVYYPFFERLPAIESGQPGGLPLLSIRLRYWLDAMSERPSVNATQNSVEAHARAISRYLGVRQPRRRQGNVEYLHA